MDGVKIRIQIINLRNQMFVERSSNHNHFIMHLKKIVYMALHINQKVSIHIPLDFVPTTPIKFQIKYYQVC